MTTEQSKKTAFYLRCVNVKSENGTGSHALANQILETMGEERVFSRTSRFTR